MTTPYISRSTKIILIIEFIFLSYMLYVLSTSLYKSYQVDRFIENAAKENESLEKSNKMLAEDLEYFDSDAYKEKIAKQNFGLVRPGEEIIILAPDSRNSTVTSALTPNDKYYSTLSNKRKWFLLFFDRDKFAL